MVRKGYLEAGRADDSLDLELGASASGVQGRKMLENSSRRGSGKFIVIVFGIHTEHPKNWVFAPNSDFLNPISLQPNVVKLRSFKLWFLLEQII